MDVSSFLKQRAQDGLVSTVTQLMATEQFNLTPADIELQTLRALLLPMRYKRNQKTISVDEQLKLFTSRVAVIGCGGLGGYITEELARLGVGNLTLIDPDVFEEHNLNRQLFSSPRRLAQPKVLAAATRIAEINPAVTVNTAQTSLTAANACGLMEDMTVVADAVDNIATRLELEDACSTLNIPLVHGAIAGWYGHVCTIFPQDRSLQKIYNNWDGSTIDQSLGNPAFTPAVVASLQVAEICKILLNKKGLLRHKKLLIDLLDMEFKEVPL